MQLAIHGSCLYAINDYYNNDENDDDDDNIDDDDDDVIDDDDDDDDIHTKQVIKTKKRATKVLDFGFNVRNDDDPYLFPESSVSDDHLNLDDYMVGRPGGNDDTYFTENMSIVVYSRSKRKCVLGKIASVWMGRNGLQLDLQIINETYPAFMVVAYKMDAYILGQSLFSLGRFKDDWAKKSTKQLILWDHRLFDMDYDNTDDHIFGISVMPTKMNPTDSLLLGYNKKKSTFYNLSNEKTELASLHENVFWNFSKQTFRNKGNVRQIAYSSSHIRFTYNILPHSSSSSSSSSSPWHLQWCYPKAIKSIYSSTPFEFRVHVNDLRQIGVLSVITIVLRFNGDILHKTIIDLNATIKLKPNQKVFQISCRGMLCFPQLNLQQEIIPMSSTFMVTCRTANVVNSLTHSVPVLPNASNLSFSSVVSKIMELSNLQKTETSDETLLFSYAKKLTFNNLVFPSKFVGAINSAGRDIAFQNLSLDTFPTGKSTVMPERVYVLLFKGNSERRTILIGIQKSSKVFIPSHTKTKGESTIIETARRILRDYVGMNFTTNDMQRFKILPGRKDGESKCVYTHFGINIVPPKIEGPTNVHFKRETNLASKDIDIMLNKLFSAEDDSLIQSLKKTANKTVSTGFAWIPVSKIIKYFRKVNPELQQMIKGINASL